MDIRPIIHQAVFRQMECSALAELKMNKKEGYNREYIGMYDKLQRYLQYFDILPVVFS